MIRITTTPSAAVIVDDGYDAVKLYASTFQHLSISHKEVNSEDQTW